jgi:pimeloyl-ACP methyl ester carboxylesterase
MIVEINGFELNYEAVGDGEPLLWLHGFMGAGPDWKYIFKEVPVGFRLIAPDLRGHGASTNPSGEFSFQQAGNDVRALLRHLGIGAVKAIGLSGGGITLLHMATADPALIESIVIISAPPYFPAQARAVLGSCRTPDMLRSSETWRRSLPRRRWHSYGAPGRHPDSAGILRGRESGCHYM